MSRGIFWARRDAAFTRIPGTYEMTFPQLLEFRAKHTPASVGLRERKRGIWREWTWKQIQDGCAALGESLLSELGIEKGSNVAFIGDPCIEGLLFTLAVQGIGAVPFAVYPTTPAEGVRFLLDDGEAVCVIAEDQEFVDKVLDGGGAKGRSLVVVDPKGMFAEAYRRVLQWQDLVEAGRRRRANGSRAWEERVQAGRADDVCGVYYTSGTTGAPKGAELTHSAVMHGWPCPFFEDALPGLGPADRTFHETPVASLAGPLLGIYFPLMFGLTGHVPDKDEPMETAMIEAAPTFYLGFPRIWETRASHALVEIETSSRLHRWVFHAGMALRRYAVGGEGPLRALAGSIGYFAIVRPMLDQWGLLSARFVTSGGAPLSPDLVRLWRLWGLTIREVYGSTETAGMVTLQTDPHPEPGRAGRAIPGCEIKIAADGEILVRGPGVFTRYWKREEETLEAFDEDGWLKTGDIGQLREDGNLVVVDRKRDVLVMANGTEVPASSVEHAIKYSPYIRDALLVGEGKKELCVLIEIDSDTVAQWARTESIVYTGFTNLAQNERVQELIEREIRSANAILEQRGSPTVSGFQILPKELDPEDPSEITATRKIRRRQLAEKFSALVDAMYMTEESARIASHARGTLVAANQPEGGS